MENDERQYLWVHKSATPYLEDNKCPSIESDCFMVDTEEGAMARAACFRDWLCFSQVTVTAHAALRRS